ncbi:hypothetical protein PM082_009617 [Marasmius tenuissimus]|nr:hypothetical protein PM082_009617 [Marasmius tenuissimus]
MLRQNNMEYWIVDMAEDPKKDGTNGRSKYVPIAGKYTSWSSGANFSRSVRIFQIYLRKGHVDHGRWMWVDPMNSCKGKLPSEAETLRGVILRVTPLENVLGPIEAKLSDLVISDGKGTTMGSGGLEREK